MKVSREQRPAPWLNRRDQYRLLALVGLLCLVVVAIKLAARPSSWYWLLPPGEAEVQTTGNRPAVPLDELDFRVKDENRVPLPPDVFRAADDSSSQQGGEAAAVDDPQVSADASINDPVISADLLDGVEDNTVGVRRAEVEAYHRMLEKVRRLPDEVRTAGADGDVTFTVVMLQSDDYRGKLLRITGQLHRLTGYPVMDNDVDIDALYEGWLFTGDSGNNPWRFVCTQLPPGAPQGESIDPIRIRVEGYFFKRMGYASEGGQHVAPTLLAKSFEILPAPISTAPRMQSQMRNWMLGLIALVIVGLGVMIWWFVAADRRYSGSRLHELATSRLDADQGDLEALRELDLTEPPRFSDENSGD